MSQATYITPTGQSPNVTTARLGTAIAVGGVMGTGGSLNMGIDEGKFVVLTGESQYALAAQGALIEGIISSIEPALSGGWSIGGVISLQKLFVTANGLQATPGVGNVTLGSYVVAGAPAAVGVAIANGYPNVQMSTVQLGVLPASLTVAGQQAQLAVYPWRVVSLGASGTGAPGTIITISREGT